MKKIFSVFLTFYAFNILSASDFRAGINTSNFQDSEGGGVALFYKYSKKLFIETSYNISYIRGVKKSDTTESWNKFETQRLGIRYYLKSYAQDEIKLFVSVGAEHIFKNEDLSSNTPELNTYGLLGLDFLIDNSFNICFSFGSGGKGEKADQLKNSPNYAHGFISIVGIEYNF